jgi:hypothetical protein
MKSNYNIIANNAEIAYFINDSPINVSNLELSDQIEIKWGLRINHATIARFRKILPKMKVNQLQKERFEHISVLKFLIDSLKEQMSKLSDDQVDAKLEIVREILSCIKECNKLINDEINLQHNRDFF